MNPAGTILYLLNYNDNTVAAYSIDANTGALTPVAGSPFATGLEPFYLTVNTAGTLMYVANRGDNNVSAYSIDPATGALTPVPGSPFASPGGPDAVAISQARWTARAGLNKKFGHALHWTARRRALRDAARGGP